MSEEVLDIKFRISKQDDKDIITYNIDGRYEGIFIDKDGKLVGSITGDLNKSLINNTTMLGIYKNYLEQEEQIRHQNKITTKFENAASNVKQQLKTAVTPFGKGIATSIHNVKNFFTNQGDKRIKEGGKTKSKRSYNANKTLKNRK
jgi:hypothetical protein